MLNPSQTSEFEDQEAIVRISSIETQLSDEFDSFQKEQMQNFYLAQGYILSANDLAKLISEKRPHFQSNYFLPKVLAIAGNFIDNMNGIDILGVEESDHKRAKMFQELNDFINNTQNDIFYEISKAFLLSIIGRIQWVNQYYSFEYDKRGSVVIENYSPFIKFDTTLTNLRTLKDCNFLSDTAWLSPEEIIKMYTKNNPNLEDKVMEISTNILGESTSKKQQFATWAERLLNMTVEYGGEVKGYDEAKRIYDKHGLWVNERGKFKVVDFYERREIPSMIWYDWKRRKEYDYSDVIRVKDYGRDWYDNNKLQMLRQNLGDGINGKFVGENTSVIYQTSVAPGLNLKLHDKPQQLGSGNFKFKPIFCYDFHPNALETKSVIDHIKDPVRNANLRDNTNLTLLMRSAHGGMMAEESAVKGKETALRKSRSEIGGIDVFNNGSISGQKIKEKEVPKLDNGLFQYQQFKISEIDHISGVPLNAVGQKENAGESGKLFNARVQQSDVMQAWITRNGNNVHKIISEDNIWFIQNFMKEERSFRILQDFSDPYWITINKRTLDGVINDTSVGKYDVRVSETPIGKVAKEIDAQKGMQLIEILMKLNPQFIDPKEIVKLSTVSNRAAWMRRIELVEGQLEQQLEQQTAIEQQQTDAVEEENLLNFAKEYAGLESQLQQNKAFIDDRNFENVLSQATQ